MAFLVVASRDQKVVISDFTWSVSGKTAPYSFSLVNKTDESIAVVVVLEAHNVSEGRDGTKLHPFGFARIEVNMAGSESRKIDGVIQLLDVGTSATTVSYHASLK